jgi:fluoride ion exporter CrcB/FEX
MKASLVIVRDAGFASVVRRLVNGRLGQLVAPEFPLGILASTVIGSRTLALVADWFAFCGPAPQPARHSRLMRCSVSVVRPGAPHAAWQLVALSLGGLSATLRGMRI